MSGESPKKTASKSKKAAKPTEHPKYIEMVKAAITALKERSGSSRIAIEKYIKANYKVTDVGPHLKMALKKGVAANVLVQTKGTGASGSFKVNKEALKQKKEKKKPAKKPTTKKPAAKKPAAKKPTAKKSAVKKPAAKKATTKKPAAKKTSKKPAAKKAAAKPKTAQKKAPAKKPAAKKAAKSPKKAAKK